MDPFYEKKPGRSASSFLRLDSWVDSSLYEAIRAIYRTYQRFSDFMAIFRVSGFRRLFVELASDGLTFASLGFVLMAALALPAFHVAASGEYNQVDDYAITLLDQYGNEIGRRGIRTDNNFELAALPQYMINATIATEDRRFYEHFGIDLAGIARATFANVRASSLVEGGSSITQQLAKNLFLSSERTISRKIDEAFLSLWLEANFSKDEILKMYFDRAYLGGGNFGIGAAAKFYFGKNIRDISLAEAALLAGLFKSPTNYAPHINPVAARARANEVLTNLVQAGYMTESQVSGARIAPARAVERRENIDSPNYFLDWVFAELKGIIKDYPVGTAFVVRTTIDPELQRRAENSVASTLLEEGEIFRVKQGSMVVLEPDGAVRAMVGGSNYDKSQFNRATSPTRQPGSSFKPFVYATALELENLRPDSVISDSPICIGNWCPKNYNRSYSGRVTLKRALARSINTVPVRLSRATGTEAIADLARVMGIRNSFPVTRSLPLGVISVSVLDMASSYAVFANGGYKATAYGISRVTTLDGNVVFDARSHFDAQRLLQPETVAGINEMLREAVTSGTGRRAQVSGIPVAGKTGTTQSYRDAWFCGYTGNYVGVVWYGNDDYEKTNNLTGGRLPAQTWQKFMSFAHSNITISDLTGVEFQRLDRSAPAYAGTRDTETSLRTPSLTPAAGRLLLQLEENFKSVSAGSNTTPDDAKVTPNPGSGGN